MVPYCMACSWMSPHGSKRDGTSMKSAPASPLHISRQVHARVVGKLSDRLLPADVPEQAAPMCKLHSPFSQAMDMQAPWAVLE